MSKKISKFIQSQTFEQADLINVVRNSVNVGVSFSSFSAALGVTGTIASVGGGTSLLSQPTATTNLIRSIEDGSGILASISATNGVQIKHNFTFDATGEPLTDDAGAFSPVFKSLVGKSGVSITSVGNTIEFAGDASSLGVVIIESEEDFPTASGGFITLVEDTTYLMSASVTTANQFILANNVLMTSNNPLTNVLTSTAVGGSMFTGVDTNVFFDDILVNCPAAECLNISFSANPNLRFVMLDSVIISCTKVATFNDLSLIDIFNCSMISSGQGITLGGSTNWNTLLIDKTGLITTSNVFVGIDLGTSVFGTVRAQGVTMRGPSGSVSFDGLANSGNMAAGSLGIIINNTHLDGITSSANIIPSDIRWEFVGNNFTVDSINDALLAFNGNAVETVISVINTPVIVNATWVLEDASRFTTTTAGRATYIAERTIHLPIDISIGIIAAGGGTKIATIYLALNGSIVANTGRTVTTGGSTPVNISIPWQLDLNENDFLEVYVENNSDTVNLIVEHCILRVN